MEVVQDCSLTESYEQKSRRRQWMPTEKKWGAIHMIALRQDQVGSDVRSCVRGGVEIRTREEAKRYLTTVRIELTTDCEITMIVM